MGRVSRLLRIALSLAIAGRVVATSPASPPQTTPRLEATGDAQTIQPLLEEVENLGELLARASDPAAIVCLSLRQADVLGKLVVVVKPEEREPWLRHMADFLQMAASYSPPHDRTAYRRLVDLESQVVCQHPGTTLAAHVVYREMQAAWAIELRQPNVDHQQAHERWRERLTTFVQQYPRADDTPDALMELALVDGVLNRDQEIRQCYHKVVESFPDSPQAKKADGALRRMNLVGRPLNMTLPLLFAASDQRDEPFDIEQLRGKVVVVYCWAGNAPQVAKDFLALRSVHRRFEANGVEVVWVSLNDSPQIAKQLLANQEVPGIHVFQRNGVNGIWAQRHGIQDVPLLMLVGKDGNVVSQGLGISELEGEISKLIQR